MGNSTETVDGLCEQLERSLLKDDAAGTREVLHGLDALDVSASEGLVPGQRVGGYRLVRILGRGGMASVHLAVDVARATPCALKVLERIDDERGKRLRREGKALSPIRHPNVVSLVEVLDWEGMPVLVLEYVDGPTLAELLASRRPSPEQARTLGTAIVLGVREAHRVGVVHRDLKPQNVLVAQRDAALVPKVADFGLAKVVDPSTLGPATLTARAFGTPAYMAPEQFRDPAKVGFTADVYSLGCILYELLAGRRAFDGRTVFELYAQADCAGYRRLDALEPSLPRDLVAAVHRCLDPQPEARFPSCDALLNAWVRGPVPPEGRLPDAAGLVLGEAERAERVARAREAAHLDATRLAADASTPVEQAHLARCARCRVQRRRLRDLMGPDDAP